VVEAVVVTLGVIPVIPVLQVVLEEMAHLLRVMAAPVLALLHVIVVEAVVEAAALIHRGRAQVIRGTPVAPVLPRRITANQ